MLQHRGMRAEAAGRSGSQPNNGPAFFRPVLAGGACQIHAAGASSDAASRARRLVIQNANPAFSYGQLQSSVLETRRSSSTAMTVDGAVGKTGLLLAAAAASAAYTWMQIFSGQVGAAVAVMGMAKMAGGGALVAALATMFKPQWAPYTGLIYALCKGAALASFSAVMELRYPGIAMTAVLVTFSTAASLLVGYQTRVIQITDKFRDAVMTVTGGYFISMTVVLALGFFGVKLPMLFGGGPVAIGLSLVSAGLAAANLLLDFDFIKQCARQRLPAWMEWYAGFSLMLTLVWMYTQILQLLGMFSGRNND